MLFFKVILVSTCAMYFVSGQYQVITDHAQCPTLKCCEDMKITMSSIVDNRTRQIFAVKNNLTHQVTEVKNSLTRQATEANDNLRRQIFAVKENLTRQATEGNANLKRQVTSVKQDLSTQVLELKKNLIGQITELKENFSNLKDNLTSLRQQLLTEVKDILNAKMCEMKDILLGMGSKSSGSVTATNCAELRTMGIDKDGIYQIKPDGKHIISVRCDMTTDGGGWTIFQRRLDGSVDFYREWNAYKFGFGQLKGEFWLGLDKMYHLTKSLNRNDLRIDMEDFSHETRYAIYDYFAVSSESNKYKLTLGAYSGNARDSLSYHKGQAFSTKDKDNDKNSGTNCAVYSTGAWWYHNCAYSNLNGVYHRGAGSPHAKGVFWYHWKGYKYSLKKTEMKIRPSDFLK